MNLRGKLKISFSIMVILPLVLCGLVPALVFGVRSMGNGNPMPEDTRRMIIEIVLIVLALLVITSCLLSVWIYRSVIRPLKQLKLAVSNIKEGNYDFEMPKVASDEIGELCTEFEEMRVILKSSVDEKLKSEEQERELIRNISHDLKTPLTAIKGYIEGLRDGVANTPEKQEKYIRTIANKVNDMDRLINELIICSRLDADRVPYTFVKVNAGAYFDDCCDELSDELSAENIELKYKNHLKDDVYINADPEQLKRVVNNIISNSVKYMNPDRQGRINIDIYDEGSYLHVKFNDNGKGIADKDISRIFERFYRTDDSRNSKQGGSGIGLAIVKKIVNDHKGKIYAESVLGEGTTMHMDLPVVNDKAALMLEDKHADRYADKSEGKSRRNIRGHRKNQAKDA